MSTTTEDMYSCEYKMTEEEIKQMEEMEKAYDEMLAKEAKDNPVEIGYCGFPCDGRCQTCGGTGSYDPNDEM